MCVFCLKNKIKKLLARVLLKKKKLNYDFNIINGALAAY